MTDQTRLAQLLKRLQEADDQTEKAAIVAEMAFERLDPDTANIARRCVILRWFDAAVVQAFVDHDVTDASPGLEQSITEKLAMLPFVETLDWGLAYHEQTRAGLLKMTISTDHRFLRESAALAAPAYANRDSELAPAEALYCWVMAGNEEEAHLLLDALLAAAGRRYNWRSFGTLFANIAEAEDLPFVSSMPLSANHILARGIARYDQGDLDNAIADYDQAIALNPDDAIAFLNRGIARKTQGDIDAATSDFIQAIAPASAIAVSAPHSTTVSSKRSRAQSRRGKTDPDLLRRLQAGDNLAWEQLLAEWQGPLYQHLCYSLPTPDNARDVLQETIEALVVDIKRFDGQVAISTLLYSIAAEKVADFFRERKIASEIPEFRSSAYRYTSSRHSIFSDVRNNLQPQYLEVLLLRYQQGLTVSEVAQVLGHSYKTTESLLSRSREQLEANLRKMGISR